MRKIRESTVALVVAVVLFAAGVWGFNALTPTHSPLPVHGIERADAHGWHWVKCVGPSWRVGYPHLWVRKHDGSWVESYWGCMGYPVGAAWWQQFGDQGIGAVG